MTIIIDDNKIEKIRKLTEDAINLCYQCGTCTAECPWGYVKTEGLGMRHIIRRAQLGLDISPDELWRCTTCSACEIKCPRGVQITKIVTLLRDFAVKNRKTLPNINSILWSIYWTRNTFQRSQKERASWAKGLNIPTFTGKEEILLYVGCTFSYEQRAQKVARSLVKILQSINVSFGILYENEQCCGDTPKNIGSKGLFEEFAKENIKLFGKSKVLVISPHCYDVFKNDYPRYGAEFTPIHYTQYLSELIENGRIKLKKFPVKVTYHDPCYLVRRNNIYEEPRYILLSIPELKLIEMQDNKENTICCGGGGGRMWLETKPEERFSNIRIKQALETGAEILATSCPYCITNFEDSAKTIAPKLQVKDIIELVEVSLDLM
jgi:Fe-S oxidoreductase